MAKVYDSPAQKGMLFPPDSGAGDDTITVGAEGTIKGVGQFVIGEKSEYLDAATAVNLTTAIGLAQNTWIKEVVIKNATSAANALYVGPSGVTNTPTNARVELAANQAWSAGPYDGTHPLMTDMIYLVGTANAANIAFISVVT